MASAPATEQLPAGAVFARAEQAIEAGQTVDAEVLLRALAADPDVEVRTEARFRLAKLLDGQGKLRDAAVLYRAILDEKPDAQRVRVELAAVLARLGDLNSARRALRQAQAGSLPPDVAQLVDQYAAALRSFKPLNASFEIALAPSTNINRATRNTTLDTILAPFELSGDARERSGTGVRIGGQVSASLPLNTTLRATARVSGQANLYGASQFNDVVGAAEAGVEIYQGKSRIRPVANVSQRWFGGRAYATTYGGTVNWTRAVGKRAQVEVEASAAKADYRINALQDGAIYDFSIAAERAFSTRFGGRLSLNVERQTAADPAYATASGGASLLAWREAGATTVYATAGLSRLEADARLALFPARRQDWLARGTVGLSWRRWRIFDFAPLVRVSAERNWSTVGLYDYRRLTAEFGLTRAF